MTNKKETLKDKQITLEWNGYVTIFHSREDVAEAVEKLKEYTKGHILDNVINEIFGDFGDVEEVKG